MPYRFFLFLGLFMFFNTGIAQNTTIVYKGKLVEKQSKDPIPYASVVAVDSTTKKAVFGTTTLEDGTFTLNTNSKSFTIEIRFMGFKKITIPTTQISKKEINLGVIEMFQDLEQLQEVVVQGEVSKTVFKLDKRVFNVGKDLSTAGASALEVLNNVPSVNVSIEGDISLRGSQGVQVLINGKPSIIASEGGNVLGTITADMIENIEVITNPSAKYDAEGTSGIINIIIKKEQRKGVNGSISVNTGVPDNHSIGISLNKRSEKLNVFTQLGAGYRELPRDTESTNVNFNTKTTLFTKGREYRNENFYNFILENFNTNYNTKKTLKTMKIMICCLVLWAILLLKSKIQIL